MVSATERPPCALDGGEKGGEPQAPPTHRVHPQVLKWAPPWRLRPGKGPALVPGCPRRPPRSVELIPGKLVRLGSTWDQRPSLAQKTPVLTPFFPRGLCPDPGAEPRAKNCLHEALPGFPAAGSQAAPIQSVQLVRASRAPDPNLFLPSSRHPHRPKPAARSRDPSYHTNISACRKNTFPGSGLEPVQCRQTGPPPSTSARAQRHGSWRRVRQGHQCSWASAQALPQQCPLAPWGFWV